MDLGVKVGMAENVAQGRRKRSRRICDSRLELPTASQHDQGTLLKRRRCHQPAAPPSLEAEGAQLPGRGDGLAARSSARASLRRPLSLTLMMTASFPMPRRMLYQIPGEAEATVLESQGRSQGPGCWPGQHLLTPEPGAPAASPAAWKQILTSKRVLPASWSLSRPEQAPVSLSPQ